jgi:hypothetical protein
VKPVNDPAWVRQKVKEDLRDNPSKENAQHELGYLVALLDAGLLSPEDYLDIRLEFINPIINKQRTLEMGGHWLACLPITVEGRTKVADADSLRPERIEVFEHKDKFPRLEVRDLRMTKGTSYKALEGKKVRVTIDVVEDKK